MPTENALKARSNNSCELCTSSDNLSVFPVPPTSDLSAQQSVYLCNTCLGQVEGNTELDINHLRCLTDAMWNQEPAVQVMAYRMLHKLLAESWAQDALDMLYLEDAVKTWAEQGIAAAEREGPTRDSNGAVKKVHSFRALGDNPDTHCMHFMLYYDYLCQLYILLSF